jgi:hypothetical protein
MSAAAPALKQASAHVEAAAAADCDFASGASADVRATRVAALVAQALALLTDDVCGECGSACAAQLATAAV